VKSVSIRARRAAAPQSPNHLLAALSAVDYAALVPQMRRVALAAGDILSEPSERTQFVHFPETAVLSLVIRMKDGGSVEAATIGNEGVVGLSTFLGDGAMTTQCLAQITGEVQRMTARALLHAVSESPTLGIVLRRYSQAFINQLAQSVACNRLHDIQQRCARWLLMTHDRVGGGDAFDLTQEFLSYMLGVRREGVSAASHALQDQGIIRYRRGHLSVLDRPALERAACECYGVTRADFGRLFG